MIKLSTNIGKKSAEPSKKYYAKRVQNFGENLKVRVIINWRLRGTNNPCPNFLFRKNQKKFSINSTLEDNIFQTVNRKFKTRYENVHWVRISDHTVLRRVLRQKVTYPWTRAVFPGSKSYRRATFSVRKYNPKSMCPSNSHK